MSARNTIARGKNAFDDNTRLFGGLNLGLTTYRLSRQLGRGRNVDIVGKNYDLKILLYEYRLRKDLVRNNDRREDCFSQFTRSSRV